MILNHFRSEKAWFYLGKLHNQIYDEIYTQFQFKDKGTKKVIDRNITEWYVSLFIVKFY